MKLNTKTGQYYEVGDAVAREKVGQLLREAIAKRDPAKVSERKERRKAQAIKTKLARSSSAESASTSFTRSTPKPRLSVVSNDEPLPAQPQNQIQMMNLAKLEELGRQHAPIDKFEPLPYHDDSSSSSNSESSSAAMQWLSDMAHRTAAC